MTSRRRRPTGTPSLAIDDPHVSDRVQRFPESVIREMTRVAEEAGAINLAQGFPNFDPPAELLAAADAALRTGNNQYSVTWGAPGLRAAIAAKARRFNHIEADPDRNVVVTCGATEAMMAAMLALVDPGDEVIVLEPFYENYLPDTLVTGAKARVVRLAGPDFTVPEEELKRAFTARTKAIIVNTPHNPTGRVLTENELRLIADLCQAEDVVAVTDEIYEHIVYDGRSHRSLAAVGGMADRTVTLNGISKTYSATGWRVGWAIAPEPITRAIRRAHDFLTVCAPHALQVAAEVALGLPESYYQKLVTDYQRRRDLVVAGLTASGFKVRPNEGAYYLLADFSGLSPADDRAFSLELVRRCGVAAVPGSSFFLDPDNGRQLVRFAFPKTEPLLREAMDRLARWPEEERRTPPPTSRTGRSPARRAAS